jgi:hypothetical protein
MSEEKEIGKIDTEKTEVGTKDNPEFVDSA